MNFIDTIAILLLTTILSIIIVLYIFWNMPWITGYWKPRVFGYNFKDFRKIMIVSDVHLWKSKNVNDIGRIVREKNIDAIIVAGDLFDESIEISSTKTIVETLKKAISAMDLHNTRLIFIPSRSFHDFRALFIKPLSFTYRDIDIVIIPDIAIFKIDKCNDYIVVTHGDYAFRSGVIAFLLDIIGVKLFRRLSTGELLRKLYSLDRNVWLVYGHSHIGYIDYSKKIINTGCWKPMELLKVVKIGSSIRGTTIYCNSYGYLEIAPIITL